MSASLIPGTKGQFLLCVYMVDVSKGSFALL